MHKTIFTNHKDFGGDFFKEFSQQLDRSSNLLIASGYFGTSTILEFEEKILDLSKKGICKILIGMIFFDGVTETQKEKLTFFDKKLRDINPDNGVYISMRPYHGKIYQFSNGDFNLYLGSSNFSKEGFSGRLECTTKILDDITKQSVADYLKKLFEMDTTIALAKTDLKVKGKKSTFNKISTTLKNYECSKHEYPDRSKALGECKIKLRVDDQPRSSLNLYFEKGRLNKDGKYAPRPWYEVEITTTKEDRECSYYPKSELISENGKSRTGVFTAYIKDGDIYYKIKMVVHADYGKNFSSHSDSGGRETLGKLLKGKLERAGVLSEGELITSEVLELYGRNYVSFVKMSDDVYILEF